ncbi:hypothetical protein NDU88_003483 [Pleurodeles waltl]|uniref:Uncharacterized protein n=1 Tax=Pleurodeles waltl TaxID=8319 RepID=A0AAV7SFE7_PLEWA|nr:hypothetical protein NDU88_003483 [Pleurodeles waltl]
MKVIPSLRTYFKVLPGAPRTPTREERMQCEEKESALVGSKDREASVSRDITDPTDNSDHNPKMALYSPHEVCPEKQVALGGRSGDSQGDAQSSREVGSLKGNSLEDPLSHSITGMLKTLSVELRCGFETSKTNQVEIRNLCEDFSKKIDELAGRIAALDEEVGNLRAAVEEN